MSDWLTNLVEHYGTWAVLAGTALEGEAVAMTGGIMAHQGHMHYPTTVIAAAVGGYASDLVLFWLGRTYRDSRIVRRALEHEKVQGVVGRLSKNLDIFALTFRFLPGMKTAGAMSIATLGMSPLRFAGFAAISASIWAVIWVSMGFALGHTIERLFGEFERIEHVLIPPLIVVAILWIGVGLWRRRSKGARPAGHA
jgi:membrane protein DedA with SNARE-associated domain